MILRLRIIKKRIVLSVEIQPGYSFLNTIRQENVCDEGMKLRNEGKNAGVFDDHISNLTPNFL
jgi:hypothetical protein